MTAAAASPTLEVALIELTSIDSLKVNQEMILRELKRLEDKPPKFIGLPENAAYLRIAEGGELPGLKLSDSFFSPFVAWANRFGAYLHFGSVPLALASGKKINASVLISPNDAPREIYRKIHLFDVDVEGARPVRESEAFQAGDQDAIFFIDGWKFGSSICYDLRFAELYTRYALAEVDVILIPSAFLVPTGKAHWDVLTRARAIESQAYLLAAAQGGKHIGENGGARETYGHSRVIDPWGAIIAERSDEGLRVIRASLEKARIEKVRQQIPMRTHRRLNGRTAE